MSRNVCLYCEFPLCACGDCHNELCLDYMESFDDCSRLEEDYDDFGEVA